MVCRSSAATGGVGTDWSWLSSSGITSRLSCYGEPFLHMLVQNKAILSWCGDSRTTTARAIVGGVVSMLKTVDSPDVIIICICNDLRTLSCS